MIRRRHAMTGIQPDDSWNKGDPYEMYVGRWSCLVADEFLTGQISRVSREALATVLVLIVKSSLRA